ncbi:hypothetical protein [Yersinia pseudotuberculosis]|uniref:hypothetical protein n=1 Tax=Yersinia pseudotuberculosis TaxID=633 RepID=UPI0005E14356|nr:hypothetical protein [Yersinia pseudotuberculosis]CNJ77133.1 ATPase involved in DNA repair [Yersinia pseudotuberculosis]
MKLVSLFLKGRAVSGLESEVLIFAKEITELFGPNGSGKTPLLQSVVYCLGYPCKFRDDIYNFCEYAQLEFEISGEKYTSRRDFKQKEFYIRLVGSNGQVEHFHNEITYSKYIIGLLNLPYPSLVTIKNEQTHPYLSTLLPIFYVDQDDGYSRYYSAHNNFIKDQFSEMLRVIFGLPERNSFISKKELIDAEAQLEYLDKVLVVQRREVELARSEINVNRKLEDIDLAISNLNRELSDLKDDSNNKNDALSSMNVLISSHKKRIRILNDELDDINRRKISLAKIKDEINIEINTLNINEEAKRVFRSFKEICPSDGCKMFSQSSESYGKNLLYLRDQIKDIERNIELDSHSVDKIKSELDTTKKLIEEILEIRDQIAKSEGISSIVETISIITANIFTLQLEKSELQKVGMLEEKYFENLNKRELAQDRVETLKKGKGIIPRVTKLKIDLKLAYIKWLEILNTLNIDKNITFKDDFYPNLGSEVLTQLKGSTRVRAILAYKAALVELMCVGDKMPFKFIIFDTPKQHETHYEDIDKFMNELKVLSMKYGFQVVFSSTEYKYVGDSNDMIWEPKFPGEEHEMFLERN